MKPVIGKSVKVRVNGIEPYGIFVECSNNYNGLIHISEISEKYVKSIDDYVSIGDEIYAKVIAISENDKHLDLSIKNFDYLDNNSKLYENLDLSIKGFDGLKAKLPGWIEENIKNHKNEIFCIDK